MTKKLRIAVTAAFSFPEHLPAHIAVLKVSPYFSTALGDNMITYVHVFTFLRVLYFLVGVLIIEHKRRASND